MWGIIYTKTLPKTIRNSKEGGRTMEINVTSQLGTKVFLEFGAAITKQESEKVSPTGVAKITGMKQEGNILNVTLENLGETHIKCDEGSVKFRNEEGKKVSEADLPPFSVLPKHKRTVAIDLNQVKGLIPSKKYNCLAVVDFGGKDLAGGKLDITLPDKLQDIKNIKDNDNKENADKKETKEDKDNKG